MSRPRASTATDPRVPRAECGGRQARRRGRQTTARQHPGGAALRPNSGLGDIAHITRAARSADDRVADKVSSGIIDVIEQAQRVIGKPEDKVHASCREDPLSSCGNRL